MRILDWNRRKVQNLSAWEIWFFIAGRVLVGVGIGILAMKYVPDIAGPVAIPGLLVGLVLLFVAAKGLRGKPNASGDPTI
jgi:hypothetical protein